MKEPRVAESGLRVPSETEYSFVDFMARNTPYCFPPPQKKKEEILKFIINKKILPAYMMNRYLSTKAGVNSPFTVKRRTTTDAGSTA